jgi:phospholipase D1/2
MTARTKRLLRLSAAILAVTIGVALAWQLVPSVDPQRVLARLEAIEKHSWSPLFFIAAYVVGGLVMFPVTVLSAATATIFVPLKAVAISFPGILLSAALLYWIGARVLKGQVRSALGPTAKKVDAAFGDRSIVTIALIRMVPLAPFTLVNLAAGSLGVRFRDYMLGTALGLAPGITVVCLFGRQVRAFWKEPSLTPVLIVGAIAIGWIGFSILLQRWLPKRKPVRRTRGRLARASSAR